ncbi:MAG: hypothetical protein HYV40_04840 [Candidatus Levybacteria bacterium]|nr:hypothetical protein [Candidatus Levybacteria bacterium]
MILIIRKKATQEEMEEMAEDLDGYIKVVVDIEQGILAGGGKRHFDAEQVLLGDGSHQEDLWGGGYDRESGQMDYNSMINVRPRQGNMSRDIMSTEIRKIFDRILKDLLL